MAHQSQIKIPATYMRGGTSKGVFFRLQDLPESCQVPGAARDKLFMRVIGSPDPYSAHIDGMGGATSSTSKCVILSKSSRPDHDVEYLYGQVSIDKPFVDWSGNLSRLLVPSPCTLGWSIRRGYRVAASVVRASGAFENRLLTETTSDEREACDSGESKSLKYPPIDDGVAKVVTLEMAPFRA